MARPKKTNETFKKDFYTAQEVAQIFNVTLRTVYRWIKSEKLPCAKLGHWIIKKEDLEELLKTK